MRTSRRLLGRLVQDTGAATAIEYALLAALIAGVIVAALLALGPTVAGLYSSPELIAAFD